MTDGFDRNAEHNAYMTELVTDPTEAEARGWVRNEGPEGPGGDCSYLLFVDSGSPYDLVWLPPGLEHAIQQAVRATEREKVRAEFRDLLDVAEDMLPYVPEYFREKWGHDEGVERARLWLARDEVPE